MSLDIKGVQLGLIKLTRDLIGHRLSSIPAGNGETKPSVIKARSGGNKPNFPYATIDYTGLIPEGRHYRDSYINEDGNEVREFDTSVRYLIQISSGVDDDPNSIMSELRSRILTSQGERLITEYLLGSSLLKINEPRFFDSLLNTDFEETVTMTIDLSMRDFIVDDTTGYIEQVEVEGNLYNDFKQVNTPLSVDITAP